MSIQLRWIVAAVATLAVGEVSAQGYANPNYATGYGYGNGYTHVVRCESFNGRSNFCRVNAQGRVFITRQLSQRQCVRGRNWNADYRGIWVGGGCRADFAIAPRRGPRQGGGYAVQGGGYGGGADGMNGRSGGNDYRGDPNRGAGYSDPRYGNNDPRYGNTDQRAMDDSRDSDRDEGAPPEDPADYNQPQH